MTELPVDLGVDPDAFLAALAETAAPHLHQQGAVVVEALAGEVHRLQERLTRAEVDLDLERAKLRIARRRGN